jgi:uncharacterized protein YebE (UPF0316 family)
VELPTLSIPLLIFAAEMLVVTVGTLRIIFVARGLTLLAPLLGFIEVLTWLLAIGLTMQNLDDWKCFIAFALGFTVGNWLGIVIEKRLAIGAVIVRIISHLDSSALVNALREARFGVTCVDGAGASGKVQIIMSVIKRRQLPEVVALIEAHQPGAFYAVDDLQSASEGIFPTAKERPTVIPLPLSRMLRLIVNGAR